MKTRSFLTIALLTFSLEGMAVRPANPADLGPLDMASDWGSGTLSVDSIISDIQMNAAFFSKRSLSPKDRDWAYVAMTRNFNNLFSNDGDRLRMDIATSSRRFDQALQAMHVASDAMLAVLRAGNSGEDQGYVLSHNIQTCALPDVRIGEVTRLQISSGLAMETSAYHLNRAQKAQLKLVQDKLTEFLKEIEVKHPPVAAAAAAAAAAADEEPSDDNDDDE